MNSPLSLFAAELGIEKGCIGFLGGIMPFAQVLCIAFLAAGHGLPASAFHHRRRSLC